MELTEERVREIVREEIRRNEHEKAAGLMRALAEPMKCPRGMTRTETALLTEMGLDPFKEAEKPKPGWMDCWKAAELRAAGIDPMTVIKDEVMGVLKDLGKYAEMTPSQLSSGGIREESQGNGAQSS